MGVEGVITHLRSRGRMGGRLRGRRFIILRLMMMRLIGVGVRVGLGRGGLGMRGGGRVGVR